MTRETWAEAVLAVLGQEPTRVWELQEIYAEIAKRPIVTPHHLDDWHGQPNYHHWVRSAIARLKRQGRVAHVATAKYRVSAEDGS